MKKGLNVVLNMIENLIQIDLAMYTEQNSKNFCLRLSNLCNTYFYLKVFNAQYEQIQTVTMLYDRYYNTLDNLHD